MTHFAVIFVVHTLLSLLHVPQGFNHLFISKGNVAWVIPWALAILAKAACEVRGWPQEALILHLIPRSLGSTRPECQSGRRHPNRGLEHRGLGRPNDLDHSQPRDLLAIFLLCPVAIAPELEAGIVLS